MIFNDIRLATEVKVITVDLECQKASSWIFTTKQIKEAGNSQTHLFSGILNMLPGEQAAYKDLETYQEC